MLLPRRVSVALAGGALVASSLAGCNLHGGGGQSYGYYDRICVDPHTGIRLDPFYCHLHSADWYYVPAGTTIVAVHQHVHVNRSYYHQPSSAKIYTGSVPASGGKLPTHKSGPGVSLVKTKSGSGSTGGGSSIKSKVKSGVSKVGSTVKSHFGGSSKRH